MKKLLLFLSFLFAGGAASAQDFILKNLSDHFSISQSGAGINVYGNDIKDNQGNYFLKSNSLLGPGFIQDQVAAVQSASFWINGASRIDNYTILGNSNLSYALDVIAKYGGDAIRVYQTNNVSGVGAAGIGFYSGANVTGDLPLNANAVPGFRILGHDDIQLTGFQLKSPGLTIPTPSLSTNTAWMIGSTSDGSQENVRTGSYTAPVLLIPPQVHFLNDIFIGTSTGALTAPMDGTITSGSKLISGLTFPINGSNLYLRAGKGWGSSGAKGEIHLQTPDYAADDQTAQTWSDKAIVTRYTLQVLNPPVQPNDVVRLQDLSGGTVANDASVVHLANAETITGVKTFSSDQVFRTFTLGYGGGNVASNMLLGTGLNSSVTGGSNMGIGTNVMTTMTTGVWNLAVMINAQRYVTTGQFNQAIGVDALENNTTGSDNVVYGRRSFQNIITGNGNVAIGSLTGYAASGASSFNVLLGSYAGYGGTYGSGNIFIGTYAGNNLSGDNQFILANGTLTNTTPTPLLSGNFATGQLALPTAPTTSAASYALLTRNTSTGAVESIGSGRKVIIGDVNGNIVMTNKIILADGRDIVKSPGGNWFYVHVADDGSRVADSATVSIDGSGNATVTIP